MQRQCLTEQDSSTWLPFSSQPASNPTYYCDDAMAMTSEHGMYMPFCKHFHHHQTAIKRSLNIVKGARERRVRRWRDRNRAPSKSICIREGHKVKRTTLPRVTNDGHGDEDKLRRPLLAPPPSLPHKQSPTKQLG